jgi:Fe2+ or Zn2+ uptake regulation protein
MTAQRQLILETLDTIGGHPTAEQLCAAVRRRDPTINPSTIYRTLGWLAEAGLVSPRRLEPDRRGKRREQFDTAHPTEHYHFVCERCGRVLEFASSRIEQAKNEFARQHRASIRHASLTLYGLCDRCREQPFPGPGARTQQRGNQTWRHSVSPEESRP